MNHIGILNTGWAPAQAASGRGCRLPPAPLPLRSEGSTKWRPAVRPRGENKDDFQRRLSQIWHEDKLQAKEFCVEKYDFSLCFFLVGETLWLRGEGFPPSA